MTGHSILLASVRFAIVVALLLVGCRSRRTEVVEYVKTHAVRLVSATRSLASQPVGVVAESDYPAEIRPLDPAMVAKTNDGVAIYIYSSPVHVTGIFIRQDPTFVPPAPKPDSDEFGYEPIAADIYWFSRPR